MCVYTSAGKMDRDTEKKKLDAGKEREQVARGVEQATAHPALLPPNLNSLNQKMNKLAEFRNTIQRQIDHADKVHARIERRRIAVSS